MIPIELGTAKGCALDILKDGNWHQSSEFQERMPYAFATVRQTLGKLARAGIIERRSSHVVRIGNSQEYRMKQHGAINIMSGYGCHINALYDETVAEYKINLGHYPQDLCVAVWGEDLGKCLAAVVYMGDEERGIVPALVWSDVDGSGTPIKEGHEFAEAVAFTLKCMMLHLNDV